MINASTVQNRQRTERREGQGRLLLALLGGAVAVSALAGANLQLTGDAEFVVQVGAADRLEDGLDRDVEGVGGVANGVCSHSRDRELRIENLSQK